MYDIQNQYLYEILEDYQEASSPETREAIFQAFCGRIWNCPNTRRVYERSISFRVSPARRQTELGRIFQVWSDVPYLSNRRLTKETGFEQLIRQKINNTYTQLFDDRVCSNREYMELLSTPKRLYFRWLKGEIFTPEQLTILIDDAMEQALKVKETLSRQKMSLDWPDYQALVQDFLRRAFENYTPIDEYENNSEDDGLLYVQTSGWNEDHFPIRYLCRSLDGYFRNYQKEYYQVRRGIPLKRCDACGALFEDHSRTRPFRLCPGCKVARTKEKYRIYNQKRRKKSG